ncbi:MAG: hypothetical protein JNM72_02560 [Deltaproteobacteria bacterium]|nr:hypothetical protein [Deltaproteobacteria bacterium]
MATPELEDEAQGAMKGKPLGDALGKHGCENAEQRQRPGEAFKKPIGLWLDDIAGGQFIAGHLGQLKTGTKKFDLPPGLGRVVNPNGTFSEATRARLVPSGSGVNTAYPIH